MGTETKVGCLKTSYYIASYDLLGLHYWKTKNMPLDTDIGSCD